MVSVHAVEKKKGRVLEKYTWLIREAILGNFDTVKASCKKFPLTEKKKKAPSPPPPCPL